MIAVTYMNRAPAANDALIAMIKIVEAMQIVQVPGYRGMLAVDLKGVESLMAAGIARGFEDRQRAVLESCQKGAGVVDADFFHFARQIVLAFLDKGFGHGVHRSDAAVEPESRVDAVSEEVAGDAAAGGRDVQPP